MTSPITLEQIYADYDVLSKADKTDMTKHVGLYRNLMTALKAGTQERRLAAQFLSKFLVHYLDLADEVVNSLIDLLENEDVLIRKQGVIELTNCCKISHQLCAKVADVFAQLLVTSDAGERTLVSNNLLNLFKLDSKGTLAGVFTQIISGDLEVRQNAIKFVSQRMTTLPADTWKGEIEQLMIEYCNKAILGDSSLEEFVGLTRVLAAMPSLGTLQGRQQLVETIADVANLNQPFDCTEREQVVRITQCSKQALQLFSKNVPSNRFALYLIQNVLPSFTKGEPSDDAVEFIKLSADLATHFGPVTAEQMTSLLDVAYDSVIAHLPMPPVASAVEIAPELSADNSVPEDSETTAQNDAADSDEKLHYTQAESVLYLFHKLASRQPDYLTAEKTTALKPRLQYFAQRNQLTLKKLKAALAGKKSVEIEADEALQLKQLALRTCTNIHALIIDLLHVPPSFKAVITLSWRQTATDNNDEKPEKHRGSANGHEYNDSKRARYQQGGGGGRQHGRQWRGGSGHRGGRRY